MGRKPNAGPCNECGRPEHYAIGLCQRCYETRRRERRKEQKPTICPECGKLTPTFCKGVCQPCYHRLDHAANRIERNAKNSAAQAKRREERPGELEAYFRNYYENHRNEFTKRYRTYYPIYVAKPEGRAKIQANVLRRRARIAGLPDTLTAEEWQITLADFGGCCAYCGSSDRITADHFISANSQGPCSADNILPACKSCNSSKRDRLPQEFCSSIELYERLSTYILTR